MPAPGMLFSRVMVLPPGDLVVFVVSYHNWIGNLSFEVRLAMKLNEHSSSPWRIRKQLKPTWGILPKAVQQNTTLVQILSRNFGHCLIREAPNRRASRTSNQTVSTNQTNALSGRSTSGMCANLVCGFKSSILGHSVHEICWQICARKSQLRHLRLAIQVSKETVVAETNQVV